MKNTFHIKVMLAPVIKFNIGIYMLLKLIRYYKWNKHYDYKINKCVANLLFKVVRNVNILSHRDEYEFIVTSVYQYI